MKEIKSSLQITTPDQDMSFTSPYSDLAAADWVHLLYTALLGLDFSPVEILTAMRDQIAKHIDEITEDNQAVLLTGPPGNA